METGNTHRLQLALRVALLAFAASSSLIVTACNTVEGAGKDTQALGQDIQDSANKHK